MAEKSHPTVNKNTALSVAIVNWNARELLASCLDSLLKEVDAHPALETDVIVVDNASSDGSQEMVRSQYPWVCLIENQDNLGFAQANNQAIQKSQSKYVLLLNPDTEIMPGSLNQLVEFMEVHSEAGMAGARLLNSDGTLQHSCFQEPTLLREFWLLFHFDALIPFGVYRMEKWDLDEPREVEALLGACMLVPREIIRQIGLLDDNYFMYSEEIDFCTRVRETGRRIYWVPQAQIIHRGKGSTRHVPDEMFLQLYRGKLRYLSKHHGRLTGIGYRLILGLAAVSRLLLMPFTLAESRKNREFHLALSRRYWHLLRSLPNL